MLTGHEEERNANAAGLPRRQFLKVGVLGTMLNLPQFLQGRSLSGAATGGRGSEKSCIFIVQQGGASHIDTWDLKPAGSSSSGPMTGGSRNTIPTSPTCGWWNRAID